jgi:ketose-bisphosphate aldolase
MSVVSMPEILAPAFQKRYGVGAFNIVNDLTMEAILGAAEKAKSPVIIQVSVKTVKMMGAKLIQLMFQEMAGKVSVPTTLHLDHCPDISVIKECLEAGWNSVLFDASQLTYEENLKQTKEVVALAHRRGAAVEGELEAVRGVEDGIGDEEEGSIVPLDKAVQFIRETGIDSFAPAIGTAHGIYKGEPKINFDRVTQIVGAQPIPIVLHGGTGLKVEVFRELISRGAAKVNISTQLKVTFADGFKTYLDKHPTEYNPLKLLAFVRESVLDMAMGFFRIFGSEGKAS